MPVHWGLEAHTTLDTTETHLLELVPLRHFIQQCNGAPSPAASPWGWDLSVLRLPSPPAAGPRLAAAPPAVALGHSCQGRSEQNVAPFRNTSLCRVTRLPTKTWAKPTAAALQTGFLHFSLQICIYQQGRSLQIGHIAFVATACVWSNLFRQRSAASGRHLLNIFTY